MSQQKENKKQGQKKHRSNLDNIFVNKKQKKLEEELEKENLEEILGENSDSEELKLQQYQNKVNKILQNQEENSESEEENYENENSENSQNQENQQNKENKENQEKQAEIAKNEAWVDEHDKEIDIDISQVARLRKLRKTMDEKIISGEEYQKRLKQFYNEKLVSSSFYSWAFKDQQYNGDSDLEDEDMGDEQKQALLENILKQDNSILQDRSEVEYLPQEILDIQKFSGVKIQEQHDAVIQEIDFHQNSQIFLTGALDKMVKIYNIRDSAQSQYKDKIKLIKSIYLEGLPVETAKFINNKGEILVSGLKKHLLCIDLQKDKIEKVSSHLFTQRFTQKLGKFVLSKSQKYIALFNKSGYFVMILDGQTKQFLFEIKTTEGIRHLDFAYDDKFIFVLGVTGSVFQYDLNKRSIFDVFQDESVNSGFIKCGKSQVAIGSQSGIVNVYQQNSFNDKISGNPLKEIQNLTTEVSEINFNYSNEIMAIGSKWKKNSVRFVHMPSYNVFQNWPNFKTNIGFPSAISFSYDNRFVAFGNEKGHVNLYNLAHYNNKSNQSLI
ncbi:WD40-repeat-containing domain [Pseudocohnilembus persalinus]|uniref:WD40-repeat-containing domain n=1 Tax=Pseudocohnilembus persalinus TaxID=266149 RepID=A0A0V0QTQ3_PSEPJ|nr:WD40-repeat-containing domain [Pseudocohnilembus persalinus]|eukprot:KRX05392.1 WD40-repeat-containing domain [Pseudocohnilembus persalinus]